MYLRNRITPMFMAALAVMIFSMSAHAQSSNLAGDWTGNATFNNNPIPLDFHFTAGGDGSLSGTVDVQNSKGFKFDAITFEGNALKCTATLGNAPVEFTGTLSADGNTLEGTFQGGQNSGTFKLVRGTRPVTYADDLITAEQLATAWKGMADYTIEMAEMMPEEHYDYKPVDALRSWGEQCNHVSGSNHFFGNSLFGTPRKPQLTATAKPEVVAAMKESFDAIHGALKSWAGKDMREVLANGKTRFQTFLFMTDHLTHTRGIMIMYLRMKDMAPPPFRSYN